jgi:hypothetical protein
MYATPHLPSQYMPLPTGISQAETESHCCRTGLLLSLNPNELALQALAYGMKQSEIAKPSVPTFTATVLKCSGIQEHRATVRFSTRLPTSYLHLGAD